MPVCVTSCNFFLFPCRLCFPDCPVVIRGPGHLQSSSTRCKNSLLPKDRRMHSATDWGGKGRERHPERATPFPLMGMATQHATLFHQALHGNGHPAHGLVQSNPASLPLPLARGPLPRRHGSYPPSPPPPGCAVIPGGAWEEKRVVTGSWKGTASHGVRSLQLLLGAQLVAVAALLLAAVDGAGVQPGVAPARRKQRVLRGQGTDPRGEGGGGQGSWGAHNQPSRLPTGSRASMCCPKWPQSA